VDSEDEPLSATKASQAALALDSPPALGTMLGARPMTTLPSIRLAEGRPNRAIDDRDQIDRSRPSDIAIRLKHP